MNNVNIYQLNLLSTMPVEEKAGQLLMMGFEGQTPSELILEHIHDRHVGGVILFARNVSTPQQVATLTGQLQSHARQTPRKIPLIIAADQEGGVVVRITEGATVFPGNMALGATGSTNHARAAGEITGAELRAMGIGMNLAPVLDVNNNPANPGIGVRSFGESPELVAQLGSAFISGLQANRIIATAKHFPGKGDIILDSHIALPTVPHSRERLEQVELLPFRRAIKADVGAIMTAHVTFPTFDPAPGLPATLSQPVLTGLLRRILGFRGLIITDDLEMGAIAGSFGVGEAAVRAIAAGADIVLVCHTPERQVEAYEALVEATQKGIITKERLNEAVGRILMAKDWLRLGDQANRVFSPFRTSAATAQEIADAAATLVQDREGLLPAKVGSEAKIVVISPEVAELVQVEEAKVEANAAGSKPPASTLGRRIRARHAKTAEAVMPLQPTDEEVARLLAAADEADFLVVGTYNAHLYEPQARAVNAVLGLGKPAVVVALRNPYDLAVLPAAKTYLAVYGHRDCNVEAAVKVIFGEISPKGRLPVRLPAR